MQERGEKETGEALRLGRLLIALGTADKVMTYKGSRVRPLEPEHQRMLLEVAYQLQQESGVDLGLVRREPGTGRGR